MDMLGQGILLFRERLKISERLVFFVFFIQSVLHRRFIVVVFYWKEPLVYVILNILIKKVSKITHNMYIWFTFELSLNCFSVKNSLLSESVAVKSEV